MPITAENAYHCAVKIDDNRYFFAGGGDSGSNRAFIFDWRDETWTEIDQMLFRRRGPACGLAGRNVVVAGGSGFGEVTSEFFNVDTGTWSRGPDLQRSIIFAASVQWQDSFLIVGGYASSASYLDSIYQFDVLGNGWVLRPERMSIGRMDLAAIMVGKNVANCQ